MPPILFAQAQAPQSVVRVNEAASPAGWFVGWGTLSLINAGLAQAKGHSGLLWWLISLFLGPIATFLIVVFLHRRPDYSATKPAGTPWV